MIGFGGACRHNGCQKRLSKAVINGLNANALAALYVYNIEANSLQISTHIL